jgi:pimeloyl-ACP methyl ester carboxylesterase
MEAIHSSLLKARHPLEGPVQGALVTLLFLAFLTPWGCRSADVEASKDETIPSEVYIHPNQLVAIDGSRRLNLFCQGTGEPVVLFDAGATFDSITWRHVQGKVAAITRACAYDRAGYGFSDASGRASDVRNAVEDLHRLLSAASIKVPIVYVGHSVAGTYGALLEASHPEDIAGAVLVDPVFVDDWKSTVDFLSPEARSVYLKEVAQWSESTHACLDLARSGALASPSTKQAKDCVDPDGYPDRGDQILRDELARRSAQPKNLSAMASEVDSRLPGVALRRPEMALASVNDAQLTRCSIAAGPKAVKSGW